MDHHPFFTAPAPTTSNISRWGPFYPHLSKIAIFPLTETILFMVDSRCCSVQVFYSLGLGSAPTLPHFHLSHLPLSKKPFWQTQFARLLRRKPQVVEYHRLTNALSYRGSIMLLRRLWRTISNFLALVSLMVTLVLVLILNRFVLR